MAKAKEKVSSTLVLKGPKAAGKQMSEKAGGGNILDDGHGCTCCNIAAGLSYDELEDCLHALQQRCLTHRLDSYRIHSDRKKGARLLYQIIHHSKLEEFSITHLIGVIWCSLSIVHHFHIRAILEGGRLVTWSRKRDAEFAMKCFNKLMKMALPTFLTTVLQSVITFFNEARLWDLELYCLCIIQKILDHSNDITAVVNAILDVIELSNVEMSKKVLRILYAILENLDWPQIDEQLIIRFMSMYKKSIAINDVYQNENCLLKKGLEVCIRYLFKNIRKNDLLIAMKIMLEWSFQDETSDDMLLEYATVLEFGSTLHDKEVYKYAITDDIFPLLLNMISSQNLLHNLLGNRILHHMLDRHNNGHLFESPRVFFQNADYKIEMEEYCSEDKNFLKDYREMFHSKMLTAIQLHGRYRVSLESIYTTLALILVEIPCGYTAASVICLAMAIQENTFTQTDLDLESSHRLHAVVLSLISLVCWIHKASIFYEYVNVILARRAESAPFLNPPLHATYNYALHHIIWNKPELFFEDWEARYGLWKCFKNKLITK